MKKSNAADIFTWKQRGKTRKYNAVLPQKGAVIVCNMWNDHWCRGAAKRVDELAPAINRFVTKMRAMGF